MDVALPIKRLLYMGFYPRRMLLQTGMSLALDWVSRNTTRLTLNRQKERIMKFQIGHSQLVIELSASPFAWFHGHTQRMSLTSLSVLFVQFSFFAPQSGLA